MTLRNWEEGDLPLLQASNFEYPNGHLLRCNDWRIDLQASAPEMAPAG